MNILFIYTNINGFHDDCYSFGLASIVSMARMNGHKCKVSIIKNKQDYSRVLDEIATFRPRIVGFSSVSSQFNYVKEIAALIKSKFRDTITVCGGVHPTINPECALEAASLDGVFVGESETSFVEFLKKIEKGEPYKNTDNLAYAENGDLILNKLKPLITSLDSLPFPDREVYPFKDTLKMTGWAPFLFSKGCPFLCSYCSNHAIAKRYNLERNYPRYRSPESSILEIEEVADKFKIDRVIISDDTFGLDKGWREEFCEKYRKRIKIKFICLLRANLIDEEFIRLLKSTGCCRVSIGVESGNEYIRNKIMNRQMSNKQIIKAFDIVRAHGLQTTAINIIGIPEETEEMVWDTIRLNRKVKPTLSGVNIFYPYKGTKLGDHCFEKKYVDKNLYHDFSNERRETVLRFPDSYKKRLLYYRENWETLVYPLDFRRRILRFIQRKPIWKYLRRLKQFIFHESIR